MTDRPDDAPHDDTPPDDAALEALLSEALAARAGGPVESGAAAPADRVAAIEAAVAAGPVSRRPFVVAAAAVLVVVLVGSVLVARARLDAEVRAGDDPSTTIEPASTTVVPAPGGTEPAPGTTVNGAPPWPSPIEELPGFDAGNFTYPSSVCSPHLDSEQATMPSGDFTLVDGSVLLPLTLVDGRVVPDGVHIGLSGSTTGDVALRGRQQVIATLSCGFNQSDGVWPSVVVIAAVEGHPTVLGSVVRSGYPSTYTEVDTVTGETHDRLRTEQIVWVRAAEDGNLQIRWNQNGGIGSASIVDQREVTVTYHWFGTFEPISESDVVTIPAVPYEPPPFNPVESFDFTSMALVLDARERAGDLQRVACGAVFQDVQPVDTSLVDGAAVVRDDGGNELGSVAIEGVRTANLDDDDLLEAMVGLRCTSGSVSVATLAVFEPTSGPPDLIWSTTDFAGITGLDDVVDAETGVDGGCPLTITYRSSGSAGSGVLRVSYRRGFGTYVEDHTGCAG
jgi:hypothetical protein